MRHLPHLALVALLGLSACSSSSAKDKAAAPESAAPTAAAAGSSLSIKGFAYSDLTVAPGTTITVSNLDDAEHTVTSDTKGAFSADNVGKGTPVTFTAPTTPGKYTFHCTYHASMHGTLTVS